MLFELKNKTQALLWQALFLVTGTSWLWASYLNSNLSYRASLISQYETSQQPYAWLFRLGDLAAGILVALAAAYYIKHARLKTAGTILAVLSAGLILDPILSTTCRDVGNVCAEYFSFNFVLHATETIITASAFFIAGIYDAKQRRKMVSILFVLFQLAYGGLFLTQWADQEHFNTASQIIYQCILIVWLAWFVRDYVEVDNGLPKKETGNLKILASAWAFFNGLLAILVSLAHLNLFGRIRGIYFTLDNAWLAQHSMVIGVVMLYLSRHLARGERRARQIFLLIIGMEVIKYSVIAPNAGLLTLYLFTFVVLFLAKDSFDRGTVPLTWQLRLKDLAFLVSGLLLAAGIVLLALDRDNRVSVIAARAIGHFNDYVAGNVHVPKNHLTSVLLANSLSAFLLAATMTILWILFKPNRIRRDSGRKYDLVRQTLERYSKSSEDYFKLWPQDKNYYWGKMAHGFVAYKIIGTTIFAVADPIGADKLALLNEFNQWSKAHRLKICHLPIYDTSVGLYKNAGLELMQIGSSAYINIEDFTNNTIRDKWWRWKLNQAKKSGYVYEKSMPPHEPELIRQLKKVSDEWLKLGGHAERGFALGHFDGDYLRKCVIHFLVDQRGMPIAFANEVPQFFEGKTRTVDLIRYTPEADNAMPFLLASLIQDIAENDKDIKIFDLGFVPFAKAKGPLLTIAKALSSDKFSSKGLEQFKNKFNPQWQPNYMAYDGDIADLAIIAFGIEKLMGQK